MSRHPLWGHPIGLALHWLGVVATYFFPAIGVWLNHLIFGQTGNAQAAPATNMWSALVSITVAIAPVIVLLRRESREERERDRRRDEDQRNREWGFQRRILELESQVPVNETRIAAVEGRVDAHSDSLHTTGIIPAPPVSSSRTGARPTLLIAEDEPFQAKLLARWFEAAGYVVTTAANLAEAIVVIDKNPHWAIIDLRLVGGQDGRDILKRIWDGRKQTRVIIATGITDLAILDEARRLVGQDRVFLKPVDPDVLLQTIRRATEEEVGQSSPKP